MNEISEDACICRNCKQDLKRNISSTNYIPRWRKQNIRKCLVPNCNSTPETIIKTEICSLEEVESLLAFKVENEQSEVLLCQSHYKMVHHFLHAGEPMYNSLLSCAVCQVGIKPGAGQKCPNVQMVTAYYSTQLNITLELELIIKYASYATSFIVQ